MARVLHQRWHFAALCTCFLVFNSLPCSRAQVLNGIIGTITDTTGNAIPGANVTATNTATGVVSHTVTTSAGTYVITDLIPGVYSLRIEMPGFKTQIVTGVIVDPGGRKITVDSTLTIGKAEEVVKVTAPLITIETEEPELSTTIEHAIIEELPIEIGANVSPITARGRRIDSFISLTPGVTGGVFSVTVQQWQQRPDFEDDFSLVMLQV
jgi:Carboxypeptidase regulatory-like domain